MSELLARLARTLTHHWKRGLVGAIVVIVLLGAAAGAGGEAADDFSIPGTESQQAIDLFKAHSPAFAGADSTLVFTVEDGEITDSGPARRHHRRARARSSGLDGVDQVADPFAGAARCRGTGASRRSTSATGRAGRPREGGRRGAARPPPRPPSAAAWTSRRAAS